MGRHRIRSPASAACRSLDHPGACVCRIVCHNRGSLLIKVHHEAWMVSARFTLSGGFRSICEAYFRMAVPVCGGDNLYTVDFIGANARDRTVDLLITKQIVEINQK